LIIDYGETFSSDTYEVRDEDNVLANAGSVTCALTLPDLTVASPTVVNDDPGKYSFDFTPTGAQIQAGLHQYVVTATGGVLAGLVRKWSGSYDVDNDAPLVSVRDAVDHLRATTTITAAKDLEQLRWLILVATDAIERDLDRYIVRRSVTEVHNGSQHAIILRHTPVISVTSVTESGVLVDPSGYLLDSATGFLYRGTTSYANRFAWGYQNVSVTYVAGYANPPRVARLAALNLVQSLYQQSQTAFHPGIDESSAEAFVSAALPGLSQIPGYNSLRSMAVA
jgi:hypothetical protein